jgi:ADP-ribose pyrophosphatase YjhB (NUDIX family)
MLRIAARLWGSLPNEGVKTAVLARFGARFILSVWAVVIDADDGVLLFRHTHDRAHPWGLPSGRVEGDETPEEALGREFREEVAGRVAVRRLVAALREPKLPALRLVYACDVEAPPMATSVEVDGWAYFPLDDLPTSIRSLQREAITLTKQQVDTSRPVTAARIDRSAVHV